MDVVIATFSWYYRSVAYILYSMASHKPLSHVATLQFNAILDIELTLVAKLSD